MSGVRYSIEVRHAGLNKYRHVSGSDPLIVEQKAAAQRAGWDDQWRARSEVQARKSQRLLRAGLAAERTADAQAQIRDLKAVLQRGLTTSVPFTWDSLKEKAAFPQPRPYQPPEPEMPREPQISDQEFAPNLRWFDRLWPSNRERKISRAKNRLAVAKENWTREKQLLSDQHKLLMVGYANALSEWTERGQKFIDHQQKQHHSVDNLRARYNTGEAQAVEEYYDFIFSDSSYPEFLAKDYDLSFIGENGTLVIDYRLPLVSNLPKTKEVGYILSRDAIEEVTYRQNELNALYDELLYQICLRTIHEAYAFDSAGNIKAVVFNGWAEFIDPATGMQTRSCIMSVHAERERFLAINLVNVEPKACFRALRGVGASRLHGLAAVPPLMRIDRTDARFVESREVAAGIEAGTNVAAIGWEDFEHLIREIFEKEFSKDGGEVKVTRASRDHGVDAIAFDPDPIRGGKIVIQAKRYTNTVDVSAVRDLYGTVLNEGASKGILVTTSTFGPDAYSFAKDKPLTLLDGANLLHLLERHGHRAYINLAEAKELNVNPLARSIGGS